MKSLKLVFCFLLLFFSVANGADTFRLIDPDDPGDRYGKTATAGAPYLYFGLKSQYYQLVHSDYSNYISDVDAAFGSWNSVAPVNFYRSSTSGVSLLGAKASLSDGPGWSYPGFNSSTYQIDTGSSTLTLNTNYAWNNLYQDLDAYVLDVQSIVTHEVGHIHGIAHPATSSYTHDSTAPTMAGGDNDYFDNSLDVRSLETPDKHAAIFLQLRVPALYSKISSALTAAGPIGKGYISVASGTYTESTDLTVPTGVTLDMTAGGTLQMADDKQIIVNGTFNARNATLTASANDWDGIRFNSGSGGEIYNCNLYKCGYPYYIYIYNASPTIRANTLTQWAGAYHGIYVRGSTADPTLYDNDIEINYTGVRFDNYAAGELSYNLIHVTNMYDPVLYAVGGAWVDADYRGANTFREGRYGISAQSSARVDASGTFSENDFCETGVYDLYATSSSSIYANYCNFPGASPTTYADGTSTITTQYASNSDGYCSQLSKANTLAGLESPRGEPLHPVDLAALSPLDRAWHGLKTGQLAAAEADFLALLETDAAHQALTGLAHVYTRNQSPAIFSTITRLATTTGPLQAHAMEVESHCYVIQGEDMKALTAAKQAADRFPETDYGFHSRITAMYMHYHRGELAPAAELLAETTARNETDAATIRMIHHVLERAGANVTALAVEKATPLSEASHPWDETVVVAPNPYDVGSGTQSLQFFHLPTSARIQLYDVAGRHRLTTASQGANAALTLSAQDYPAGVYLYVVEELDGADGTPTGKRTTGKFVVVQ